MDITFRTSPKPSMTLAIRPKSEASVRVVLVVGYPRSGWGEQYQRLAPSLTLKETTIIEARHNSNQRQPRFTTHPIVKLLEIADETCLNQLHCLRDLLFRECASIAYWDNNKLVWPQASLAQLGCPIDAILLRMLLFSVPL